MHDPASWFRKTWFTRRRVRELKNTHNSVTVQNRTHVYMNFFHHKDLGNNLLQLCPKVVKHPVYRWNKHTLAQTFNLGARRRRVMNITPWRVSLSTHRKGGWLPDRIRTIFKTENFFPPTGIPTPDSSARILVTISTKPSRLLL